MTPSEKQAFVARMAAARGKSSASSASKPMNGQSVQPMPTMSPNATGYGKCPSCGKVAGMVHSC